eukprot:jgi/Botrbrau1/16136/Bobra.7_2s0095.1
MCVCNKYFSLFVRSNFEKGVPLCARHVGGGHDPYTLSQWTCHYMLVKHVRKQDRVIFNRKLPHLFCCPHTANGLRL